MIQMGMGQKHKIDGAGVKAERHRHCLLPARGCPGSNPQSTRMRRPADLHQMAGAGDVLGRTVKESFMRPPFRHRAAPLFSYQPGCLPGIATPFPQTRTVQGLRRRSPLPGTGNPALKDLAPIGFPDQHHRHRRGLAGLGRAPTPRTIHRRVPKPPGRPPERARALRNAACAARNSANLKQSSGLT